MCHMCYLHQSWYAILGASSGILLTYDTTGFDRKAIWAVDCVTNHDVFFWFNDSSCWYVCRSSCLPDRDLTPDSCRSKLRRNDGSEMVPRDGWERLFPAGHLLPHHLLSTRRVGSKTCHLLCCKQYCQCLLWSSCSGDFPNQEYFASSLALSVPSRGKFDSSLRNFHILLPSQERLWSPILEWGGEGPCFPQNSVSWLSSMLCSFRGHSKIKYLICFQGWFFFHRQWKARYQGFSEDLPSTLHLRFPSHRNLPRCPSSISLALPSSNCPASRLLRHQDQSIHRCSQCYRSSHALNPSLLLWLHPPKRSLHRSRLYLHIYRLHHLLHHRCPSLQTHRLLRYIYDVLGNICTLRPSLNMVQQQRPARGSKSGSHVRRCASSERHGSRLL